MQNIHWNALYICLCFVTISIAGCKSYNPLISSEAPFQSKYLDLGGDKLHYIEEGMGDPILFLHGIPMSSYSWRNIIPHLTDSARCIAVDFMGFGKSDKPDITYSFDDQLNYLVSFIEASQLSNITLVMTDIGGIIGMSYAAKYPEKIKGMVMMEMPLGTAEEFHKNGRMMQRMMFWMSRKKKMGYNRIVKKNMFIKMMPMLIRRKLTPEERATYEKPFSTERSRIPIHALASSFSKKGKNAKPGDMSDYLNNNVESMLVDTFPKLLLYAAPGMLINKKAKAWAQDNLKNLQTLSIGKAKHLMEEDLPNEIGLAIKAWYAKI